MKVSNLTVKTMEMNFHIDALEREKPSSYLSAEATIRKRYILLTVGEEVDETYGGFHTADQLRKFAAWLLEVADEQEKP